MPDFDPYYMWLGIPPTEQPPSHYRLLGISELEANDQVIQNAADQRMAHLRTVQAGEHAKEAAQLLNEISLARVILLNPDKKQAYDQDLRARQAAAVARPLPVARAQPIPTAPAPVVPIPAAPAAAEYPNFQAADVHVSSHRRDHHKRPKSASNALAIQLLVGAVAALVLLVAVLKWGRSPRPVAPATASVKRSSAASPESAPKAAEAGAAATPAGVANRDPLPQERRAADSPARQPTEPTGVTRPQRATIHPAVPRGPEEPIDEDQGATPEDQEPALEVAAPERETPVVPLKPLGPEEITALENTRKEELIELADKELQTLFEGATSPADKARAATAFVTAAERAQDSELRYALLKIARELGVSSGHAETTFAAIDATAAAFPVDAATMKLAAVSTWAERLPDMYRGDDLQQKQLGLARTVAGLAEAAQAKGNHAVAEKYYLAAGEQFKNAGDSAEAKRMRDLAVVTGLVESITQQGEAALLRLKEDADDPAANLAAGKYLCLIQGEWKRGLARLAKGNDDRLKAVAVQELADPVTPDAMHDVGDLWWSLALNGNELEKPQYMSRAVDYYKRALPGLRPAIQKSVKARLDTASKQEPLVQHGQIITSAKPFTVGQVWSGKFHWVSGDGNPFSYAVEITKRDGNQFEAFHSWSSLDGSHGTAQCEGIVNGNKVSWTHNGDQIAGTVLNNRRFEFRQLRADRKSEGPGRGMLSLTAASGSEPKIPSHLDPVGVYRSIYTGTSHGKVTMEFRSNGRMLENGEDRASWIAQGASVLIRYDGSWSSLGRIELRWLGGNMLVGRTTERSGEAYNWVMKRRPSKPEMPIAQSTAEPSSRSSISDGLFTVGQVWSGKFQWVSENGKPFSYTVEITKRDGDQFEAFHSWPNPDGSRGSAQCDGSILGNRISWVHNGENVKGEVKQHRVFEFEQLRSNGQHGEGVLTLVESPQSGTGTKSVRRDSTGNYRVVWTGYSQGTAPLELASNGRMIKDGRDEASWTADGQSIRIRWDEEQYGRIVLNWLDDNTLVGTNIHRDGKTFHWVMKRVKQ